VLVSCRGDRIENHGISKHVYRLITIWRVKGCKVTVPAFPRKISRSYGKAPVPKKDCSFRNLVKLTEW
jgi:hypothetical protein